MPDDTPFLPGPRTEASLDGPDRTPPDTGKRADPTAAPQAAKDLPYSRGEDHLDTTRRDAWEQFEGPWRKLIQEIRDHVTAGLDGGSSLTASQQHLIDEIIWSAVRDADLPNRIAPNRSTRLRAEIATRLERRTADDVPGTPTVPTPPSGSESTPLTGDPGAVQLLVASVVGQFSPPELTLFIRDELAATVERLEREGATREEITDVITRALFACQDARAVAATAQRLLGYLWRGHRDALGYFQTMVVVGDLLGRTEQPDDNERAAVLAYHLALRGLWRLVHADRSEFVGTARRLVAINTFNSAMGLWRLHREQARRAPDPEQTRQVVASAQALLTCAAAAAQDPSIDEEHARACMQALGLAATDPLDTVAVLRRIGGFGDAWTEDSVLEARLEASGGLASALDDEPTWLPSRMFNAGVSLLQAPDRENVRIVHGRLCLNLIGVDWLLGSDPTDGGLATQGDTPLVDGFDPEGLSCLVNLAGAAVDLSRNQAERALARELQPSLVALLGMRHLFRPTGEGRRLDLARLNGSLEILGWSTSRPTSAEALRSSAQKILDVLARRHPRPQDSVPSRRTRATRQPDLDRDDERRRDRELRTAGLIRWVFDDVLDSPGSALDDLLREPLAARAAPAQAFVDRYRPFAEPLDDPIGDGPLMPSGLLDRSGWRSFTAETLRGPESMATALRRFGMG